MDVATDADGNAYVTGSTIGEFGSVSDAFVAKYAPDGALTWCSYFGGGDAEFSAAIALDDDGRVWLTGQTFSRDFTVTLGAFHTRLLGTADAFITRFSAEGALEYSTMLGAREWQIGRDIVIDREARPCITGATWDPAPVPVDVGPAVVPVFGVHAFVAIMKANGSGLDEMRIIGGRTWDYGLGIALFRDTLYITGMTRSPDFPTTANAFQQDYITVTLHIAGLLTNPFTPTGQSTCFLTVIRPGVEELLYSTFLGGKYNSSGWAVAVGRRGEAYVVGGTGNFHPVSRGAIQTRFPTPASNWTKHAFLSVLDPSLFGENSLRYSSYLGGELTDLACDVKVVSDGIVFVCGETASANFPITPDAFQPTLAALMNNCNGFLSLVDTTRSGLAGLKFSSFFGGTSSDRAYALARAPAGWIWIAGQASSPDLPFARNALSAVCFDGFTAKLTTAG